MKKKLLIISGCAFALHFILSVIAVGLYNGNYSKDILEGEGNLLSRSLQGERFEGGFITEEPDIYKSLHIIYMNDTFSGKNNKEYDLKGNKYFWVSLIFDDEGNVIREGGTVAAYKYKAENGEIKPISILDTELYGEVPVEYVFTREQYDHIKEIAWLNDNIEVKMDSYYRKGNLFYPLSVTVINNGNIVETIECQKNYDVGDADFVENDDMLMDFLPLGANIFGEYKDEDCLKLRKEVKKDVAQNGFEEGTNCYYKYGWGKSNLIVKSKNPDMNICYKSEMNFRPILIKVLAILNGFVLTVIAVVDLVIILVLRNKKTKVKGEQNQL